MRRRTSRARFAGAGTGSRVLVALACVAFAAGCGKLRSRGAPPALKAPIEAFQKPEWKNFEGKVFVPPDPVMKPWRAMMLQESPRPKKNPRWVPVPVDVGIELEMPKGSRFRCLVNPGEVRAEQEEIPKEPEAWRIVRTVRCSSDGWRSSSQAAVDVRFAPDGTRADKDRHQAELYLHDVIAGKPTRIVMLLQPG